MKKNDCNTTEGIAGYITSLAGLDALRIERAAAYAAGRTLEPYILLGRMLLDAGGRLDKLSDMHGPVPKTLFPDIPDVLTVDAYKAYARSRVPGMYIYITTSNLDHIPTERDACPECGERFHMGNFAECVYVDQPAMLRSLAAYVGMTMKEARRRAGKRRDGNYILLPEQLRNERAVRTVWEGEFAGPEALGWFRVTPEYVIQPGDEGSLARFELYHPACHEGMKARTQWTEFQQLLYEAGFRDYALTQLPNRRCVGQCKSFGGCTPWYQVTTRLGAFVIGRSMRDIEIHVRGEATRLSSLHEAHEHLVRIRPAFEPVAA